MTLISQIPVVSMTGEDQGQLERYLDRGITPRVHFNIQNTFTNGPAETANVVGEIRGTEHPEQILVVGGHLDSWDLSEGTTDNGSGTATTLGAADSIMRSGVKPRRTIRFVLFTGEEQGLDGSIAYVKQHQSEMANHLGDLILDAGQGEVKGFQLGGRSDLLESFQPFADSLSAMGPMSVDDKIEDGTDTLTFTIAGSAGNQHAAGHERLHVHASFAGGRARSAEKGCAGEECDADGASGVLDRGSARPVCGTLAGGADGEDAAGAARV